MCWKNLHSLHKSDLSFSSLHSDTFASKVAAIQDQYADASIGNVTGSNAVNVFLGIGVSARLSRDWLTGLQLV